MESIYEYWKTMLLTCSSFDDLSNWRQHVTGLCSSQSVNAKFLCYTIFSCSLVVLQKQIPLCWHSGCLEKTLQLYKIIRMMPQWKARTLTNRRARNSKHHIDDQGWHNKTNQTKWTKNKIQINYVMEWCCVIVWMIILLFWLYLNNLIDNLFLL